ncbi:MAG: hypothetical protein Q4P84_04775, partial [Elusimicrobiales bacterium]|nr:hypothetical protein [Elusimicrobiales bacterium]
AKAYYYTTIATATKAICSTPIVIDSQLYFRSESPGLSSPILVSGLTIGAWRITDIREIVLGKVTEFTFQDNTKEKLIRSESDEADLYKACFIAIAKKLYKKTHTQEGIEYEANLMMMRKEYVDCVNKALRAYYKKLTDAEKAKAKKAEEKALAAKKRMKSEKVRAEKRAKAREDAIEIQKEAYLRAMRELKSES